MAPQNTERRRALADAAIDVLGRDGVHGLSHRAVDERAGVPAGTASNYFRSRDALLAAAAARVAELHFAGMDAAAAHEGPPVPPSRIAEMIGMSLFAAATEHRVRYLAVCELSLEATRRPSLRETIAGMEEASVRFTVVHHRALGLDTPEAAVRTLMLLYANALFGLLTGPPERVTPENAVALATAMVTGALGRT
ncbi:TetR/AcrR family transcriptional regulator [Actinomadura rifamycini]|uniref:TetR/AcrR family transcriptional regulator n=1 Tax=Actinomadura rifamycini TaxID=31962 RepID=UPI00041B7843|nr:TetR family transcriptional regulator [Actinomadura rifamycini]